MSLYAIWLDREHAKLFEFSNEKMERKAIHASRSDHHTHAPDNLDHRHQEWGLFREVSRSLGSAEQILVLGPGMAKHHFRTYLTEQMPALARKVVGCETVDHPTDAQIAGLARQFFKLGAQS